MNVSVSLIRVFLALLVFLSAFPPGSQAQAVERGMVKLPPPGHPGSVSLEQALDRRKAVRSFKEQALSLQEISQLLWAAAGGRFDGVSGASRSYPSAGGIYPLELYLLAGEVDGLAPGVYRHNPREHALELRQAQDRRRQLAQAALLQGFIAQAPAVVVITADYGRTEQRYGNRGRQRYVPLDAGHAAQNLQLQAAALELATVPVGAFSDAMVRSILDCGQEEPLLIIPVGRPRRD